MRTAVRWSLLIFLMLPAAAPVAAQGLPDELTQWTEAHALAVKAYGRGEHDAAIRAIADRPLTDQRRIVSQVLKILAARARGEPVTSLWTLDDAAIAGALHMDTALSAYRRADASSLADLAEHVRLGEALFDVRQSGDDMARRAPRWELAIGLTALADGRFGVAETVLDGATAKYPQFAPLQLACGSVHESFAMFPADTGPGTKSGAPGTIAPTRPMVSPSGEYALGVRVDSSSIRFAQARAARATALTKARRAFDRALRLDPDSAETQIRLAHLDILEGNDTAAATRLVPIVVRTDLGARLSYLARLFLGDTWARAGRIDEARALLEQAIALVPSGQSAHVALVRVVRTSGDHDQASALLHRMMNAPVKPDDPMIGYRCGQYRVPDALIASLRKEAVRH